MVIYKCEKLETIKMPDSASWNYLPKKLFALILLPKSLLPEAPRLNSLQSDLSPCLTQGS